MLVRAALSALFVALIGLNQAAATERLLKLRQYTFACGTGQECIGWRHTFAYLDPAARNADLPRDTYVDVYTSREVEELIDLRQGEMKDQIATMIDRALARQPEGSGALSADDRRRLRDDVAAEVLDQFARLMAQQEAQTRAWLQELVRDEIKAARAPR